MKIGDCSTEWRLSLGAALIITLVSAIAFYLINEEQKATTTLHQQRLWADTQSDLLVWMHQRPTEKAINTPLLQVIRESATADGIKLPLLDNNDKTVTIRLDKVEFNAFFSWLNHLQQQWGVIVISIEIVPAMDEGYVAISRVVLGRNPQWN